jgi:hypothetical protein
VLPPTRNGRRCRVAASKPNNANAMSLDDERPPFAEPLLHPPPCVDPPPPESAAASFVPASIGGGAPAPHGVSQRQSSAPSGQNRAHVEPAGQDELVLQRAVKLAGAAPGKVQCFPRSIEALHTKEAGQSSSLLHCDAHNAAGAMVPGGMPDGADAVAETKGAMKSASASMRRLSA